MKLRRVSEALGAEVEEVDLTKPLGDGQIAEIAAALAEHQVLFFRAQPLSPDAHREFARRFGELQTHPAYPHVEGIPELTILESNRENPSKIEKWHTDMTFRERPPLGSILRARVVPDKGGDTLWMSLHAAYEALSPALQGFLAELEAEHSFAFGFRESLAEPGGAERLADAVAANPPVKHPVIRVHPVTGRRALFVNRLFTTHIVGLEPAESEALLAFLFAHMERPEFSCRFSWQPDSIAFWDNRSTQHCPVNDYWPARRVLERITIDGDRPYGPRKNSEIQVATAS